MENTNYTNEIIIEINQSLVDEYNAEYLSKNKRTRKAPIASPHPLSLNKILLMDYTHRNDVKQKYKEFIMWVCRNQGVDNMRIAECEIFLELVFHDKRLRDIDNHIGGYKFIADGLTETDGCGVILDDNYQVVKKLSSNIRYEKGEKKTIIHIYY